MSKIDKLFVKALREASTKATVTRWTPKHGDDGRPIRRMAVDTSDDIRFDREVLISDIQFWGEDMLYGSEPVELRSLGQWLPIFADASGSHARDADPQEVAKELVDQVRNAASFQIVDYMKHRTRYIEQEIGDTWGDDQDRKVLTKYWRPSPSTD